MLKLKEHHFLAIQAAAVKVEQIRMDLTRLLNNDVEKMSFVSIHGEIEVIDGLVQDHLAGKHTTDVLDCRYRCMFFAQCGLRHALAINNNIYIRTVNAHALKHNASFALFTEWLTLLEARDCPENWVVVGEKPGAMTRQRTDALILDAEPDRIIDACDAAFDTIKCMLDELLRIKGECSGLLIKAEKIRGVIFKLLAPIKWRLNVAPPHVKVNFFIFIF